VKPRIVPRLCRVSVAKLRCEFDSAEIPAQRYATAESAPSHMYNNNNNYYYYTTTTTTSVYIGSNTVSNYPTTP